MCGINAVINGDIKDISLMVGASSSRGIKNNLSFVGRAVVSFDWLPITDENAPSQPFENNGFSVWLNGYISNYKELAEKYEFQLKTNCDTEFLAAFIGRFKGEKLEELNGFFAVLYHSACGWGAFTDRYGIKQLYEYNDGNGKTFISSEVKSILAANPQILIDSEALKDLKYSLGVMNKDTLFNGVTRVKTLPFPKIEKNTKINYNEARRTLLDLFIKSIQRNKTDLKTGVFLSGGIDSGIIANYLNPDYTFSVDYVESKFSEIENIKLNSTGEHYAIICNNDLFKNWIDKTVSILDDPKVGSSYTNVALTSLASKFCEVLYSGAGGDEFFGGYPHRLDKPINEVINRTNSPQIYNYCRTHFEYDLLFLRGVLNIEDTIGGFFTFETRYPLLDNDLVNFALSLPDEFLKDKRILKDISGLDAKVLSGSKKGFSNPYINNGQWTEKIINNLNNKPNERFV
jgi:asparagine synthase (glutamine-hydrolysing)